ncbi:MAG: hypothetical protein CMJ58_08200 [Planctomycetaceae bacterium]|nr:hypothetical protein [Planctomycetaceae bacterium]
MTDNAKPPLTDSPWLWFALFSAVGLSALLATGGKFGKRQAGIERKYQARSAVASGELQVETDATGTKAAAGAPEYSAPNSTIIPLWPLEILLAVVCAGSVAMLLRQRMGPA